MKISPIRCKYCNSKEIIKKGFKKNKLRIVQKYQCKICRKYFTFSKTEKTTYSIKTILDAISLYNLGYSSSNVSRQISMREKAKISQSVIASWLKKYKDLTTYRKLRSKAKKLYNPREILFKKPLQHKQVYFFKYHKAKLKLLPDLNNKISNEVIEKLNSYLNKIQTSKFPHHIFSGDKRSKEQRSSKLKFDVLNFVKLEKNNHANKLAKLSLKAAENNYQRHEAIQDFMLINDTSTIAVEVPVYLTNEDIKYFLKRNFKLPLENKATPITGHIDILQLRNNLLHVLDYKPDADKIDPTNQLTIYCLSLASRLQIPLKWFKAAWFDEQSYFEFFPLHVVYEKKLYEK